MRMTILQLDAAVRAVCPIAGITIGDAADRATWTIAYMPEATAAERAAGAAVLAGADLATPEIEAVQAEARAALDRSDVTVLRCVEAGVPVPAAWRNHRAALRAIVTTGVGPVPVAPPYPEGT